MPDNNYFGPFTSEQYAQTGGYYSSTGSSGSGGGFNSWDSLISGIATIGAAAFNFGSNYTATQAGQQPTYGTQPIYITGGGNQQQQQPATTGVPMTVVLFVVLFIIIVAAVLFYIANSSKKKEA